MMGRVSFACAVALGLATTLPSFAQTASQAGAETPNPAAFIQKWGADAKGVVDLKAVLDAAMVKFEMLDKNHQGRLTQQELASVLTPREFSAANPDRDTTLGAGEWFDLVRRRFYAANPDRDGSLSADELKTPQGQALLRLVQ